MNALINSFLEGSFFPDGLFKTEILTEMMYLIIIINFLFGIDFIELP